MAETQVREIRVRVDTGNSDSSLRKIANGFKDLNSSVNKSNSVLTSFRNAFLAIQGLNFAGIGFRELIRAADEMQKLTDRFTLFEGSSIKARETLGKLSDVARETRTGISDLGVVYSRLNLSLADTGISTDALLGVTQALQNSFRLSGSTATEATNATIQLSQSLASGEIRGQELRSILEANSLVGGILAKQLGVTRGELLKFAEKNGGIKAADFLKALSNNFEDINSRAKELKPTISEGLDVAFNDLKLSLNDLNREFGITEKIVSGLDVMAKNAKEIAVGVTAVATAWFFYAKGAALAATATGALATIFASSFVGVMVKAGIAVAGFTAGIVTLPLAITGLVTAFVLAISTSERFRDSIGNLLNTGKELLLDGIFTKEFRDRQKAQAAQMEENRKKTIDLANANRVLVYDVPEVVKGFQSTIKAMEEGTTTTNKYGVALKEYADQMTNGQKVTFDLKKSLAILNEEYLKSKDISKYNKELKLLKIQDLNDDFKNGSIDVEKYNERLREINFGKPRKSLDEFRLDLSKLNAQLANGSLTIGQYSDELEKANLDKLNRDLKTGRTNALEYNESFNTHRIREWRRALVEGAITVNEFRSGTQAQAIKNLNFQFQAGVIDVFEYHKGLTEVSEQFLPGSALMTGTAEYIKTAGTLSQNVAQAITNTFMGLENYFTDFIKTGKFKFRDFAQSVIDDINKIIVRSMIVRPLAEGILGAIPMADRAGGTTSYSGDYLAGNTGGYAKGGAFHNGVQFFANGGVVSGRTSFDMAGGRKGVMSEYGPEAILPLSRNKNGDLGVVSSGGVSNVTVNVINQSGSNVEQKESTGPNGERVLDLIITQKVKESFASGAMDKTMSTAYGLRRKGQ